MPGLPHILCISRDPLLLETRQAMLNKRFPTFSVDGVMALREIADDDVRVVILCHTLGEAEAAAVMEYAKLRWPRVRTLCISKASHGVPYPEADAILIGLDGPVALLCAVELLLDHDFPFEDGLGSGPAGDAPAPAEPLPRPGPSGTPHTTGHFVHRIA